MNNIIDVFAVIAARSEDANPRKDGDYIGEDGLLYCWKCKTAKQCRPFPDNPGAIVYCICDCIKNEQAKIMEEQRRSEQERRRLICFANMEGTVKSDIYNTFQSDDTTQSEPSQVAKGYAEHFSSNAGWLLLCGTNGIGKSFYAACICNALIDKGYCCKFTSVSEIADALWNAESKSKVYNSLAYYDLLVIDDFGAERDTEYMREIQFNVFDYWLRLGKPCIITTNLSANELMNPKSQDMKRVFSRIYKKAIPIICKGEDRRKKALQQEARERLRRILE